nr:ribonuclease H-like domain-containing protein [Tanacetum cinerariifolium]
MGLAHPIGATSLQQAQLNSSGNPMGATQLNSSGPPTTSIGNTGQTTMLPHGFTAGTLHDPTTGAWNMDSENIPDINPPPPTVHSLSQTHDSPTATKSPLPTATQNSPINTTVQHIPSSMAQSSPITHDPTPKAHSLIAAHTPPGLASFTDIPTPIPFHLPQIINDPPVNPNPTSVHSMVTRFRVESSRPTERLSLLVSLVSPLPKSYRDAFDDPNWQHAMSDEYNYLADVSLSRYKARLVANGSTQLEGVDVDETFSPIIKPCIIQTVLSLAASRHWPIHQLYVKNAFLHGDLSETVYMHQPPGFLDSEHPDYVMLSSSTTDLVVYSDADWAGCPTTRRSTSEAEYRGFANVVAETCWLCNLLPAGQVRVLHVPSRYQFADIFTKGLPSSLFEEFRSSLSVRCSRAPTAGEC